jgi:hypothetical protein
MIASVSVVATASELPILDFDLRQGSGTTIIDSANGIVGTTHGTVWSTDPSGQPVLYFDNPIIYWFGDGDYMEIPYHDALNSPHITIEVWVYPMSAGYYTLFAERIRDGGTWQTMTALGFASTGYHTGTKPFFGLSFGGVQTNVLSPTDITLNEWHHIVGTYDGNDMKLYVDGEHVATEFGVGGPRDTGSNPFYIGHAPSSNHYFNGYYAQFKMYDRALTAEEVAYNFGSPVEAPVANAGLDQTVEQTYYQGADVTLDGSGSNDPDGDPLTYSWTWDDGSATGVNPTVSLPLGITTITLVVNDGTVDSDSATVVITVQDTTPPVITCPADETVEQATAAGTVVPLTATATDICDADVEITSDAPAIFPLGTTTVTFTATDDSGNSATCTMTVTVIDTTAPVISLVGADPQTIECGDTYTELGATATDVCCGDLTGDIVIDTSNVDTCTVGSYTVTYDVNDCNGNPAVQVTRTVNVEDTTLPEISVTVSPDFLWPPNHKMVDIAATVTVSDLCDADPTVVLTSVESNEPENTQGKPRDSDDSTSGDGCTVNDIQGVDIGTEDYDFQLRAERAGGGDGRIYTITYMVTDASGNSASASATVVVPHDMG